MPKKPKKFKLDQAIGYHVYQQALTLRAAHHRAFRQAGYLFTPDQALVLYRLGEAQGISQQELAFSTLKDKPNMTRIIDSLEKLKLVERRQDPKDRRSNKLYLTKRGNRIRKDLIEITLNMKKKTKDPFTEKDKQELLRLLDKLKAQYV